MKKIRYISSYCTVFAFFMLTMTACNEQMEDSTRVSGTKSFRLNSPANVPASLKTNCYIFSGNMLHQIVKGISSPFSLSVPENPSLYFFAGDTEPTGLKNAKEGTTTLEDFLNIRTDGDTHQEFYTGSATETASSSNFDVQLRIGEAQINLDATSSDLLQINKVVAENAPASSLLFEKESLVSAPQKQAKVCDLNPTVGGRQDNILRLYESEVPVDFAVEGTYDGIPVSFRTSLPKVLRNYQYTLKVVNAGAEVSGVFEVKPWAETDTINTAPNADKKIFIDKMRSTLPYGTQINTAGDSIIIPYTGGPVTLAFMGTSPVDFESIEDPEGKLDMDGIANITRESGKIMTQYRVSVVGQGENTMPYTAVLKPKSVLRKYSSSQIVVTVDSPPLYIREVSLGGLTWMAFNVQSPQEVIYPIKGNNVEAMYNNEWLASLGGMFQYGRLYKYTPWESGLNNQGNQSETYSWRDASKTPCPEGYRLPTYAEAQEFVGLYSGGLVPGTWPGGNETITATIETAGSSQININGVRGTAKYLKLVGSKGGVLHIPFGGMKSNANPADKDPHFSQGFRLWLSDEYADDPSKAWSIYCGNLSGMEADTKNLLVIEADKESYGYVRCVKK